VPSDDPRALDDDIAVRGIPPLEWVNGRGLADASAPAALTITAAEGVDWTNDAFGGPQQHAASLLGFVPSGDFSLSARARVLTERTTFDAAALAIWGDTNHWAKLCFEYSPQGDAMVVSVVTNEYSDDCNSSVVPTDSVYLRVVRSGAGWAFHSSADGQTWTFVRVFRIDYDGPVYVGFLAQAPMGDRCVAEFSDIAYGSNIPSDFRDGS
jgi:regulation of enolase protein 1 (concanavalin A-like superfamily)